MASLFKKMDQWYKELPGRYILESECLALHSILPRFFGYFLVQFGGPQTGILYKTSAVQNPIHYSPEINSDLEQLQICGSFEDIACLLDSVDVVMLPHVLEFINQPQPFLKDIYRILVPGGSVIILGFNPLSLWGLSRWFQKEKSQPPWQGKFHHALRLRSWLTSLGFTITYHKTFCFRPLIQDEEKLKRLSFLETVGQWCWPFGGAVYLLVAMKRAGQLTPIRSQISSRVRVSNGYAEPTARLEKIY